MEAIVALVLISTLSAATPVALAAIGGAFTAQVNVFNVGLEGLMLTGAFAGFLVSDRTGSVVFGFAAGALCGALMAGLLAVVVLALHADEVVAGLGINLGALGLTAVLAAAIYHSQGSIESTHAGMVGQLSPGPLASVPVLGQVIRGMDWMTVIAAVVVVFAMLFTYRSKHGMRMRAIGSNAAAASAAGIPVRVYQYVAFLLSGLLCGLAGAYLPLSGLSLFAANMTSGVGYIALAAVLFGSGRPGLVALGAYLYGVTFAVGVTLQKFNISAELVQMLPWIATIVALAFAVRRRGLQRSALAN